MQAESKRFDNLNLLKYIRWILFTFVGIYIALLVVAIAYYAVDIPYWDEWELLGDGWLINNPFGKWIIAHHNEHRVIPTHLLYLLNYYVFGLNFKFALVMNIPIFGLLVYAIVQVARRSFNGHVSDGTKIALLLGITPLLSNIIQFNHMMSGQNCIHFSFLGLFLGLLFVNHNFGRNLFWTGLFWIMAIYSFAGGIPAVWITYLSLTVFQFQSSTLDRTRARAWSFLGLALLVATLLWFVDYPTAILPTVHQSVPTASGFSAFVLYARYWTELLSLGFGFMTPSPTSSFLCFILIAGTVLKSVITEFQNAVLEGNVNDKHGQSHAPIVVSALLGMCAVLSVITLGRFQMGFEQAKSARYAEISAIIPVLTVVLLLRLKNAWLKFISLGLMFCLLAAGLRDDFGVRGYSAVYARRMRELNCVRRLIENPLLAESEQCPGIYPGNLATFIENGRKLEIHFTAK